MGSLFCFGVGFVLNSIHRRRQHSGVEKNHLGIIFKYKQSPDKEFLFYPTLTSSFVGYFFVPGPLEGLKSVPGNVFGHIDSICIFFMNICWGSKNRIFSNGGGGGGG